MNCFILCTPNTLVGNYRTVLMYPVIRPFIRHDTDKSRQFNSIKTMIMGWDFMPVILNTWKYLKTTQKLPLMAEYGNLWRFIMTVLGIIPMVFASFARLIMFALHDWVWFISHNENFQLFRTFSQQHNKYRSLQWLCFMSVELFFFLMRLYCLFSIYVWYKTGIESSRRKRYISMIVNFSLS